MEHTDVGALAWAAGWLVAVVLLFRSGLRVRLTPGGGVWRRRAHALLVLMLGVAATALAITALDRHDTHIDLTRERAYTPSPQALAVADALSRPVTVTYYYQGTDPNARRALEMLELMAARNGLLEVSGVDPDKQPSLARTAGMKLYNTALIEADGHRVLVHSTDESELAIGIQRALRERAVTLCFVEGHHEYSVDNAEFANEVERAGQHEHDTDAALVIETTPHGIGRWRRSLEGLGYDIERIALGVRPAVPPHCAALIVAGPRTPWAAAESAALERYVAQGGSVLLLLDVGFDPGPEFARLLRALGAAPEPAVIVDTVSHYGTDAQTVAVTAYAPHPITARVAYTYFPGARPLTVSAPDGVTVMPLVESSRHAVVHAASANLNEPTTAPDAVPAPQLIAIASEGHLDGASSPFRAIVGGDADFVSNAHFPYLANSDLALGMVRWLVREEDLVATAPRVPVAPLVLLTEAQLRVLYIAIVGLLPLTALLIGVVMGWRRR